MKYRTTVPEKGKWKERPFEEVNLEEAPLPLESRNKLSYIAWWVL